MGLNRKRKNFNLYWKFCFVILVCLAILSNSDAQQRKSFPQPLIIINASDTVTRTVCTYDNKITIKCKLIDIDSSNYIFDSIWVFSAIPDRQLTIITKHLISKTSFSNTCSLTIQYKQRVGNEGFMKEPDNCLNVMPHVNIKYGNVRLPISETVRLYYTYKGKYKIARYYKTIDNRPTYEKLRKESIEAQKSMGDYE
jgi:hypothetical protein